MADSAHEGIRREDVQRNSRKSGHAGTCRTHATVESEKRNQGMLLKTNGTMKEYFSTVEGAGGTVF